MSKKRLLNTILLGMKQLKDPYYQGFAAQLAFYFLLSIVPIIILLSQLLGVFSISMELLENWVNSYVEGEAAEIIIGLIRYAPSGASNIAFLAVALWSSSRAQFSMMRITNYTFSGGKTTGNGYFRERFRAVKTIIFTLFTITFALIILVYGELIIRIVLSVVAQNIDLSYHIDEFWFLLRWPAAMALYFLMVSYNYYVLPSTRMRYRDVLPGSIFASVGMLLVTWFFTVYTGSMANYDIIYGSLASIVAMMFWFYLLAWALGLGVVLNKVWSETKNL